MPTENVRDKCDPCDHTLVDISLVPRPLPDLQILSCSRGEKSGEGLRSKVHHGLEMVDLVSTNRVHVTY